MPFIRVLGFYLKTANLLHFVKNVTLHLSVRLQRTIEETGNKYGSQKCNGAGGCSSHSGYREPIFTAEAGRKFADEIGYPVMIKAALGGGGKGMRVVQNSTDFEKNFQNAQREAENGFGDNSHVY